MREPIVLRMKGGTVTTLIPYDTRKPFVSIEFKNSSLGELQASVKFDLTTENVAVLEKALAKARAIADGTDALDALNHANLSRIAAHLTA